MQRVEEAFWDQANGCWCRKHVTIVHGENGTGKSAIMQALQVCLGASARDTGAAASIKAFIKTGECLSLSPSPPQSIGDFAG